MTKPVVYPVKFQRAAARVLAYLIAHPEKHDQSNWVGDYDAVRNGNVCGTTMCIAGASVYLHRGIKGLISVLRWQSGTWAQEGANILGLTDLEADKLFYNMSNDAALQMLALLAIGDLAGYRVSRGLPAVRGTGVTEYFL